MNINETTTIGTGYDTFQVERGCATGHWLIYRIGVSSDAYIGREKTQAAAIATAKKLAGVA